MGKIVLDFSEIVNECGVETEPPDRVIKNLAGLQEFYDSSEIVEIYNYILTNNKNCKILSGVIKLTNSFMSNSTLSVLLDLLLKKNIENADSDDLINMRINCAKAISAYKDNSTLGALLYCLNDKNENYRLRLACADALGRIGNKYAVEPLIDVIKDEDEKSIYVKESATFALGLIGDASAIDPLVSILEAKQGILDKFTFLKERIIEALGKLNINNSKVLKVLKSSLLDPSPTVRIDTIEALMNSEYDEATEIIRSALHDSDEEVQRNALIALYNMVGRDILDEVISLPGYSKFLKNEAGNLIAEYEED